MSRSDCALPQCRSGGISTCLRSQHLVSPGSSSLSWLRSRWVLISHQWYVQLDSVLSIVLNDVPVNACNDTYVSSSYVCLESAFCLSYLVFHGRLEVSSSTVSAIYTYRISVHCSRCAVVYCTVESVTYICLVLVFGISMSWYATQLDSSASCCQ